MSLQFLVCYFVFAIAIVGLTGCSDEPQGSRFQSEATLWQLPEGGNPARGFWDISDQGTQQLQENYQLIDMTGDKRPDLVITSRINVIGTDTSGNEVWAPEVFSDGTGKAWKVFENTVNGFATTPSFWAIPEGGDPQLGFYKPRQTGVLENSGNDQQENYLITDITGDNKPDLVITSQINNVGTNDAGQEIWQATNFVSTDGKASWKVFPNTGSGFAEESILWTLPQEGGETTRGYDFASRFGSTSEIFFLQDMNGDNKLDLVRSAAINDSQQHSTFPTANGESWRVHFNEGNKFADIPLDWTVPTNGGSVTSGFYNAGSVAQIDGDETYSLRDMTGDGMPDLIVTSRLINTQTQYGPTLFDSSEGPAWKLYRNTGTSFAAEPEVWAVPTGGNPLWGFWTLAELKEQENQENYVVTDLTGDGIPDLLVTSQFIQVGETGAGEPVFDMEIFKSSAGAAWKIYPGEDNGFAIEPSAWIIPEGGNPNRGFWTTQEYQSAPNHENYTLTDINGDNLLDLVVTSKVTSIIDTNLTQTKPFAGSFGGNWKVYFNSP